MTIKLTPAQTLQLLQEVSSAISGEKVQTRSSLPRRVRELFWAGFSHKFFELTESHFRLSSQGKGTWKPLAPSTIKRKKRKGVSLIRDDFGRSIMPILIETGRLFSSLKAGRLTTSGYKPKEEQVAEFVGNKVVLGSEVPYAEKQHLTRPLFPEEDELIRKSIEAGIQHLTKHFKG